MIDDYSEITASIQLHHKELDKLLANREWDAALVKAGEIIGLIGELRQFLITKETK